VALLIIDVLFAPPQYQVNLADYQNGGCWSILGKPGLRREPLKPKKWKPGGSSAIILIMWSKRSFPLAPGMAGKGWCQGTRIAWDISPVPSHITISFSPSLRGERIHGSVIVLTLYSVVLFTGLQIAGQSRDRLGKLLAVGVVAMLFAMYLSISA